MKTALQALVILVLAGGPLSYGQMNDTPPAVPSQEEPEVLNQGPIHEGFARPLDLAPQAGIVSPEEPPADIVENPAAERPRGSQYVWIPGYWAWDTERTDYVWVSGCWRVPPAGMSWIPGYWNRVPQGWQWVAGFWIATPQAQQIQYLPPPPEIVDVAPPTTAIVTGQIWVPPCYYWRSGSYVFRAGYWLTPQDKWVWVPSHYAWTPYGYVFVPGYWDYVLTTRGVLYAPVYFPRRFHRPVGYRYSLGVVVNIGNLEFGLFSSPRYRHYYFGDYYSDFYVGLGIYPWFECETRHSWYDPIYEHDRYYHRRTMPQWDRDIRHEYDLRRADPGLRPPRTYRELESRPGPISPGQRNGMRMVEPIRTYAQRETAPFKFSQMSDKERQRIVSHTNEVNDFRQERRQRESRPSAPSGVQPPRESRPSERITPERSPRVESPAGQAKPARPTQTERPGAPASSGKQQFENRSSSERMNYPRSPITGRSSGGLFRKNTPSQSKQEARIEQKPGGSGGSRGKSGSGDRGRR
ncbi:MAG: YXWGXW repeat-containing protein [Phycisphaerales bacterium]